MEEGWGGSGWMNEWRDGWLDRQRREWSFRQTEEHLHTPFSDSFCHNINVVHLFPPPLLLPLDYSPDLYLKFALNHVLRWSPSSLRRIITIFFSFLQLYLSLSPPFYDELGRNDCHESLYSILFQVSSCLWCNWFNFYSKRGEDDYEGKRHPQIMLMAKVYSIKDRRCKREGEMRMKKDRKKCRLY